MTFPIHLRYEGQTDSVALPLFPDAARARSWWQALAYVKRFVAPSGLSFILFDEHVAIRYPGGQPHQGDLLALLEILRHGFEQRPVPVRRRAA